MDRKAHWENTYTSRMPTQVGWYEPHLTMSLDLITLSGVNPGGHVIDVGGGASTLVDDLLERGFKNITVLDISPAGLDFSRRRLGSRASDVEWIEGDVTEVVLPGDRYDLWHDRAVFHFLALAQDRLRYLRAARKAIKAGGGLIMGVFGPEAPPKCSGLDVVRYSPDSLRSEMGEYFVLLDSREELHRTPSGIIQQYVYCLFRKI